MTPEQWGEIKVVLHEALELGPAQRAERLESFYGRQPELREEVESLLRSHDSDAGFLETPYFVEPVRGAHAEAAESWIGRRLGAYQLLERIGAGGMGVVFRAMRADGHYQKQVAIKVIHAAFGTEYFLSRFKNERQILASLEHPNIAGLIDGGSTDTGLPYVVMEYVDGVPIDEYCDTRQLSTAQRLELFRSVCTAVRYAHERRVVHRDLKPGNILVTQDGVPKLLDFGIAKMLDPTIQGLSAQQSVALLQIMTPDFASPEQVRGMASSAASDVYSLGVILYWLLTGRRPYRASGALPQDIVKAICETEPERPSVAVTRPQHRGAAQDAAANAVAANAAAVSPSATESKLSSPSQLRRTLAGDLDHIVLKALRKEPASRYGSAQEFSADIGRYLSGLPVRARRGTVIYRLMKFMGRHMTGVWAAALTALAGAFLYSVEVSNAALPAPGALARVLTILLLLALLGAALLSWQSDRRSREGSGKTAGVILAAMLLAGSAVLWRFVQGFPAHEAFKPLARSLAVLPFTNLSGDAKQEYFSDGLSEELIDALSHISALQVAARTSSFSFKDRHLDLRTIAQKLNVAAILEGSVRRSGDTVRITAQLINGVNGYHLWSQTFDRDLKDVLSLQSEVATAVARQLHATLIGDEAEKIEVGGTHNPQAYDAYLRGVAVISTADNEPRYRSALEAFDQAIALDPDYAAAYARRAFALIDITVISSDSSIRNEMREQARIAAERAVALAPVFAEAHGALWFVRALGFFDFAGGAAEIERALALAPGNAKVQGNFAMQASWSGHNEAAVLAERHEVRLDSQAYRPRIVLAWILYLARRFDEARVAARDAEALNRGNHRVPFLLWRIDVAQGRPDAARQFCKTPTVPLEAGDRHNCLAIAYRALDISSAAASELDKFKTSNGDSAAFFYAEVYAQWGDMPAALKWLATAERLRDPYLQALKGDWMLDPIRNEPEFKAIERRLNFPP